MDNKIIEKLIIKSREGKYECFDELVGKYKMVLLKYSMRIEATDAYENLISYFSELIIRMPIERTIKEESTLQYIDKSLKRFTWRESKKAINNKVFYGEYTYESYNMMESDLIFYDFLKRLDHRTREFFVLRFKYMMTYEDIGYKFDVSAAYVYKKINKLVKNKKIWF